MPGSESPSRNPSRQVDHRGDQPSARFAFAFDEPRSCVDIITPTSPTNMRPSHTGTRRGGFAPSVSASHGNHSATGAGATGGAEIMASQTVTWENELRLPSYQNEYGQGNEGIYEYYDGDGGGSYDYVDESWGPPLDQGLMIPQWNSAVTGHDEDGRAILEPLPWVSGRGGTFILLLLSSRRGRFHEHDNRS